MKIHYVRKQKSRFTECCHDRECRTFAVTTQPQDATCMTCIGMLRIIKLLTEVEYLDRKIEHLQAKRRKATGALA